MRRWMVGVVVMALAGAGCFFLPETTIAVSDYDSSCALDSDCLLIREGDVCAPCGCADAAISASSRDAYERDVERIEPLCDEEQLGDVACGPCPQVHPVCLDGACQAALVRAIFAAQFDQRCAADEDCAVVIEGNACDACSCDFGAINVAARADYEAARDAAVCGSPDPCSADCATPVARCDAGTCAVAD